MKKPTHNNSQRAKSSGPMSSQALSEFIRSPKNRRHSIGLRHPDGDFEIIDATPRDGFDATHATLGKILLRKEIVDLGASFLRLAHNIITSRGDLATELPPGALTLIAVAHMEANSRSDAAVFVRGEVLSIQTFDEEKLYQRISDKDVEVLTIPQSLSDISAPKYYDVDPERAGHTRIFTAKTRNFGMSSGTRFHIIRDQSTDQFH